MPITTSFRDKPHLAQTGSGGLRFPCGHFSLISLVFLVLLASCGAEDSQSVSDDVGGEDVQLTVVELTTDTVESTQLVGDNDSMIDSSPVITIGSVRTVEIADVVFSSLPEAGVDASRPSVELGRLLFWDPILSGDQDIACATCHLPEFGYADGRQRSVGTSGVGTGVERVPGQIGEVSRNAPTVVNTVWNGINEFGMFDTSSAPMFWDSRTQSLVSQALEPIRSQEEMRGNNFNEAEIDAAVVQRLSSISDYQVLFEQAYGSSTITLDLLAHALADFQSTLVANNAPFDRWMRGDDNAMSNRQLQGLAVFADTGCADCHSGPMFSDYENHALGVPEADNLSTPDTGDGNFRFRTPTLRQLAFTAPYFHGGQEPDLGGVIDFYDNPNGSDNPNIANNQLDPDFRNLPNINGNEANLIEEFLESLSDSDFDQTRPDSVPSGLPVGGSL